jgi:fructose transport system ATP-binding protein
VPDEGEILLDGQRIQFKSPIDARRAGIETVYQDLAVAPAMTIAENLFLGRELRRPGLLGSAAAHARQEKDAEESVARMNDLKVGIRSMTQAVETLSGGQRQCVAVARAAAFAQHVVIMDEPTAALGVKEGNMVLELIRRVRDKGLPVILISHNMPHVFEMADRIHIARLGKRAAVVNPKKISMSDTVAVMTGAKRLRANCPPRRWPERPHAQRNRPPAHPRPAEGADAEMGHDDAIVLADANFTAMSLAAGQARAAPARHCPCCGSAVPWPVLPWRRMCRTPWLSCRWAA